MAGNVGKREMEDVGESNIKGRKEGRGNEGRLKG